MLRLPPDEATVGAQALEKRHECLVFLRCKASQVVVGYIRQDSRYPMGPVETNIAETNSHFTPVASRTIPDEDSSRLQASDHSTDSTAVHVDDAGYLRGCLASTACDQQYRNGLRIAQAAAGQSGIDLFADAPYDQLQ